MIFLNSASSAAVLVFELPLCTHTEAVGETERGQSPEYILEYSKTQYLMNTLYIPRIKPAQCSFHLFPLSNNGFEFLRHFDINYSDTQRNLFDTG